MSMSSQLVRHKHLVSTMLEISRPDSIVYQEDLGKLLDTKYQRSKKVLWNGLSTRFSNPFFLSCLTWMIIISVTFWQTKSDFRKKHCS